MSRSGAQPKGFPGLPEGWISEEESFPSSDGVTRLFAANHRREPWESPRALFVLHGMQEHGGRYLHVPHFVRAAVESVYCLDQRGHGRSEGARGDAESFDQLVEDFALAARRFDERLRARFGGKSELHLFAHSMGGHVALRALRRHPDLPFRSVTLNAPYLAPPKPVPRAARAIGRFLARVGPRVAMPIGGAPGELCRDPEVIAHFQADPSNHSKMSLRFGVSMARAMLDTLAHPGDFRHPIQILVPLDDRAVSSQVTLDFFESLRTGEKRLKKIPGGYHESLHDPGKELVFEDVRSWITEHGSR